MEGLSSGEGARGAGIDCDGRSCLGACQLGERIKAGIRDSKKKHGRPRTALKHAARIMKLYQDGMNKSAIARKLGIGSHFGDSDFGEHEKSCQIIRQFLPNNSQSHTLPWVTLPKKMAGVWLVV